MISSEVMKELMGKDMRDVYVRALVDAAVEDAGLTVLEADLTNSHNSGPFGKRYPERFVNCGITEANAVCVAAGLAASGLTPFLNLFACFASRRAFDQFFLSVCYSGQNVKLIGSDPGVLSQYNGGSHCALEDIAMMRAVPGLVVVEPSDTVSLYKLTRALAARPGPAYMRLHRKGGAAFYGPDEEFAIGKGKVVAEGTDVTIVSAGHIMLTAVLDARKMLAGKGVSAAVVDILTIKPLDEELILRYAHTTAGLVTCENAHVGGGLGGAVTELLADRHPTRVKRIGVDAFGEVGTVKTLQERFGLTAACIAEAAMEVVRGRG